MSKEKRRVPKLRFPGFTEDWEQRKLNEFLSVSNFKNIDNKYNKNDVLSVSGDYGIVNQIEFQGRSFAGVSVSNYGVVETGDIVYTKSPLKLNPYGIIKANRINAGIVSTLYAIYKTKKNCDSKFIEHYFNLDSRLNKYLKPLVNKGAKNDMKVSSENALIGEVCFPHVTEQKLIADFLDRLDLFITLHQRKLEHLNLKKKALLQKLFPKNGERYPELRFPGFTDAWEQRKLEDVCNVYDGTHQTPRYTNSGVMFVSVEDIETLESNKYITEKDFKSEFKVFPEYGDILLTRIGDVGSANVILDEIKRAYYVSLALLKPKDINSLFLLALLSSSSVQSEIWRRTLHIAFPKKINKNEINKVIVNQPSIPEQKKIGKLFFSLDQTITLHQRKLEHLQLQKKALLQQMFV